MLELSQYGDVFRQYEGTGALYLNQKPIDCTFEIIQFSDGHIRVHAIFPAHSQVNDESVGSPGEKALEGITKDGKTLTLEGKLLCTLWNPGSNGSQNYY